MKKFFALLLFALIGYSGSNSFAFERVPIRAHRSKSVSHSQSKIRQTTPCNPVTGTASTNVPGVFRLCQTPSSGGPNTTNGGFPDPSYPYPYPRYPYPGY